jgi:peroxiredoxin
MQCREEFPLINRLAETVADWPVRVLGVNMQEGLRQVERAQQRDQLRFEILMDTAGIFARRYGIYGLPQVMVIDKHGRLRYRNYGPPPNIVTAIKALIAED